MSGWPDALAAPDASFSLRYRTGLRKAEHGETLLELDGEGRASVANVRTGETREFSGEVGRAELDDLLSALVAADFPNAPVQTIPPGAGLIALEVSVDGDAEAETGLEHAPILLHRSLLRVTGLEHAPILLHRSLLRDHPAWAAVVRRLDRICEEVSAHAVAPAQAPR
jgi:hypothetical protein